jgi:hypothetical protein
MAKAEQPKKEVAKQTVALKYVGEGTYHGHDQAAGTKSVSAGKDQVVMVSEAKADQLLEDFPKNWEKASAKEAKASAAEAEADAAPATTAEAAPAAEAPKGKGKGKKK